MSAAYGRWFLEARGQQPQGVMGKLCEMPILSKSFLTGHPNADFLDTSCVVK